MRPVTLPFRGGCACGAIRYECSALPLRMVNCHCRDCQRASGGAYSPTLVVAASALRLLRGACRTHESRADSGNTAIREFCADCGSPLFARSSAHPEFVGVKAASLDDPSWFVAEADVWIGSAQTWDHMDPAVPKFPRSRQHVGNRR